MQLGYHFSFESLYTQPGITALDARFVEELRETDVALFNRLVTARANPDALTDKDHSQIIIDLAPHAENFVAGLFNIHAELTALKEKHFALAPLYACKRLFVQRRALKGIKAEEAQAMNGGELEAILRQWFGSGDKSFELSFARAVMGWLDAEADNKGKLDMAARYAAWAVYSHEGKEKHKDGILFKTPRKLDPLHLIALETEIRDGVTILKLPRAHLRHREGFALTDDGGPLSKTLDETNYCIWCHNQDKDSCSKGMKEKDGAFKQNSLGITLAGCPLEEKISEMNFLKSEGIPIGALAAITIDNPMCAGTGHRICNDCMKSCIYQKQEPVNIPQAETRSLKDVLELPYGFEIYSLLTRWNPLNIHRPIPKPATGKKVLVSGLGPAGYTLAHHLMNDGHTVVGIDGLKIEPLPQEISGVSPSGEPVAFAPIKNISELYESLEKRVLAGFGGVAEYGITVRWDKNYLKIIRLLLERRREFAMIGGVRFGSQVTIESAWELGFDHIALAMGAGKPTILDIPNGLARGVRAASDFLMALQLTGAGKADSIANLQLRLPVIVIGGGLTAVDTATESLAYYPVQVEKFLSRYELLSKERGQEGVRANWSEEERQIGDEFILHAKAIRAERALAASENRAPDIVALINGWGGVKIAYRKKLTDAPSYRLNHEEVEKAFEEGIGFTENLEPMAIELDRVGHASGITFKPNGITLAAKTILYAAGTSPNTVLEREDPEHVTLHGKYFRAVDESGEPVVPEKCAKPGAVRVLMSVEPDGRAISFFGDLHPSFAGNVVKAMGSAKQGYPVVSRVLEKRNTSSRGLTAESGEAPAARDPAVKPRDDDFLMFINQQLRARIHDVIRLTPNIIEVVVHAPLAAKQFQPGQFYRLQNFEANALRSQEKSTTLSMEGLALTGAWVDKEKGLLSTIILEMGGSSDLCAYLKKGEPVVLMGPTGTPTHIPEGETVLLAGGGLGNAVLFSIGRAMREKGCKVLYFAAYRTAIDRYKVEDIEAAADVVVWCCDGALLGKNRPQDFTFHGNIVQAMEAYAHGKLAGAIPLLSVDRLIAIGSDRMMAAVGHARHNLLKAHFKPGHLAIGSINSPMQCMMKEICAQCLQKHIDPETGKESYVFSCFNQDQPLDSVSFPELNARLKQNAVQEKLTAQWIDRCLKTQGLRADAA